MLGRPPKPVPSIPADPMNIVVNQFFSVDGVRFKCVGAPRVSPHDDKYVIVYVRKFGLTRQPLSIDPKKEKVLVAPLSSSTVR